MTGLFQYVIFTLAVEQEFELLVKYEPSVDFRDLVSPPSPSIYVCSHRPRLVPKGDY